MGGINWDNGLVIHTVTLLLTGSMEKAMNALYNCFIRPYTCDPCSNKIQVDKYLHNYKQVINRDSDYESVLLLLPVRDVLRFRRVVCGIERL